MKNPTNSFDMTLVREKEPYNPAGQNPTDGFILCRLPSIKAGAWRLVVIPGDHEPRHVHARLGTGDAPEAVVLLNVASSVTLREADRGLSRAELWERYC
ncbi:MAG TPA: hypothetical protein VME66_07020 [Candidatus Acidoferrales bacterium]|nr:hypothetical protein [Candidatus Acidoferrales bacterium]